MFGKCFSLLVPLILSGCAEPKYVQDPALAETNPSVTDLKTKCDVRFEKSQLCLTWYWETKPTGRGKGSLIFKTYHLNAFDQTAVQMDLEKTPALTLWMPSMGHGSSPTKTTRLDVGTYRSENVFFVMPGEWDLRFQAKDGNQIVDEAVVPFIF